MKKLMFIAFVLVMYGCSKKSEVKPPADPIVGKWYATSLKETDPTVTPSTVQTTTYDHMYYYQFNADGTGTQKFDTTPTPITYKVTNNVLSITSDGDTQQITIKSMTANELVLYQELSYQGVTNWITEMTLSK